MDDPKSVGGEAFSSPEWAPAVVEALRDLLQSEDRDRQLLSVTLISADLERDLDGVAFLRVIYEQSIHDRRIGLRRQLDDRGPLAQIPGQTLAESLASDIAHFDMAEPLGSYWYRLTEDDEGVWWWGDGYPGEWA